MNKLTQLVLVIVGLAVVTPGFAAKDPNEKAIKARKEGRKPDYKD